MTQDEFERKLAKMKNGALGIENVKTAVIKSMSKDARKRIYEKIKEIIATHLNDWEEDIRRGFIVPLHKKPGMPSTITGVSTY